MENKIKWILKQHEDTNHYYDKYLPYAFHLRMVEKAAADFAFLLDVNPGKAIYPTSVQITLAAYGHDLIEDTRISYNDVKIQLGETVADIIYAVSNEKGKNRKERANAAYYMGIRETPGAVFVKLCDRIANLQYSKMTGSRMFEMYRKENDNFLKSLGVANIKYPRDSWMGPLVCYLNNLFAE